MSHHKFELILACIVVAVVIVLVVVFKDTRFVPD